MHTVESVIRQKCAQWGCPEKADKLLGKLVPSKWSKPCTVFELEESVCVESWGVKAAGYSLVVKGSDPVVLLRAQFTNASGEVCYGVSLENRKLPKLGLTPVLHLGGVDPVFYVDGYQG